MAFILNEYDVDDAQRKAAADFHRPNLQAAVLTLARFVEWTNENSDGWAYWSLPSNAAKRLQELIQSRYFVRWDERNETDVTAGELRAAYAPIKAFLTRRGVQHSVIFVNEVN